MKNFFNDFLAFYFIYTITPGCLRCILVNSVSAKSKMASSLIDLNASARKKGSPFAKIKKFSKVVFLTLVSSSCDKLIIIHSEKRIQKINLNQFFCYR